MRSVLAVLFAASSALLMAHARPYNVTMSDGVGLWTQVDFPDLFNETGGFTAVIDRSPYGEFATELVADLYLPEDHMAVRQDFRGTHDSGGQFEIWHDAAADGYTTIEWMANGNHDGWNAKRVFSVGASADGLASYAMLRNPHPALAASFNIFASSTGYEVVFPQGGLRQSLADLWIHSTVPNKQWADHCLLEVLSNEAPGPWWDALNVTRADFARVWFPTVQWAGWYDIFLVGNLIGFQGYQTETLPIAQGKSRLVVDPLGHCQSAFEYFSRDVIFGRVALPVLLSFDLFKNGTIPPRWAENVSAVTFYVMGPSVFGDFRGEFWTSVPDWPEYVPTELFLAPGGSLASPSAPTAKAAQSFLYDPSNPIPSQGGNNLEIACGPLDQRPVESRSDVLLFTSQPLASDMYVTGPLFARLFVSSNATDTDFTAKLTDVYPDGTSRLIQDGIVRMRWRGAPRMGNQPQFLTPGQVYEVEISMWNTSYVFNAGHSIRLAISSSNYPRYSINRNTGDPLNSTSTVNVTALNTVFYGGSMPSSLILPVVQPSQLPPINVLDAWNTWRADAEAAGRHRTVQAVRSLVDKHEQAARDPRFRHPRTGHPLAAFPQNPLTGYFGTDGAEYAARFN